MSYYKKGWDEVAHDDNIERYDRYQSSFEEDTDEEN